MVKNKLLWTAVLLVCICSLIVIIVGKDKAIFEISALDKSEQLDRGIAVQLLNAPANVQQQNPAAAPRERVARSRGEVISINEAGDQLLLRTQEGNVTFDFLINYDNGTIIVDSQTRSRVPPDSIKVGDEIIAFHDISRSKSIPPQTYAYAIITDLPENEIAAIYLEVADRKVNDDGSLTLLDANREFAANIPANTPIKPYKGNKLVSLDDIKLASQIIVWADSVTQTFPAGLNVNDVMLVTNDY